MNRNQMNTISIRERHPEKYEELFSRCQIVVSLSDNFLWTGGYSRFFGGLTILQKVPAKTLVGLELLSEEKFCIADKLWGFEQKSDSFVQVNFNPAKETRIVDFFQKFWQTFDTKKKIKGFKIHILNESHGGGGLGLTGVITAGLSLAIHLALNKITTEDIASWQTSPTNSLINENEKFLSVFRVSWHMLAVMRDGIASGATSFAALLKTPYPILFFSEPSQGFNNSKEDITKIPNRAFWGAKMEEVFPLDMPQPWPIDLGRVFTGNFVNTEIIFKSLSKVKMDFNYLQSSLNEFLFPKIKNDKLNLSFVGWHNDEVRGGFCEEYIKILNGIAIRTLVSLKNLFKYGPNEESMRTFIEEINEGQLFYQYLGHSTNMLNKIGDRLTEAIALDNEFNFGATRMEGIGRGGHLLVIGPAGSMSNSLIEVADSLSKEMNRDIYLDWASWIDGFGEPGPEVEQFLSTSIISPFVKEDTLLASFYKNAKFTQKIIGHDEAEKIIENHEIILDKIKNKIYFGGIKVGSNEFPSAKATVDIMYKIIKSPENKITNQEIGDNAYANSRYDLQSKIFIPIEKAVKKYLKKNFIYKISGGIYDDYSVSMSCNGLDFAIFEDFRN